MCFWLKVQLTGPTNIQDRLQPWKQLEAASQTSRCRRRHRKCLERTQNEVILNSSISQAQQLESNEDTSSYIMGVMIESNLVEGRQDIPASGPAGLKYGQSVTDACLSWEMTVPVLDRLRQGVQGRRALVQKAAAPQ
jgi:phospho-2-dehydro-3-deoxyheptonate aldolase